MIKICIAIATILIIFTYILNKKSYDFEKLSQYECGIEPFDENISTGEGETREKFYLKFYIIGIIFLIFDLESLLLYPIVFSPAFTFLHNTDIINITNIPINWIPYFVFLIFMFMLILGLIYEYKKKVLN
jgi:NADH:ubiquinone oxidoreductase subunit 3 (subunit A)